MNLLKIVITEWRDASSGAGLAEVDAAQDKLQELSAREREVRADLAHAEALLTRVKSVDLADRMAQHVMELDNLHVARKAALAAEAAAGNAVQSAMRAHPMVGSFGYQVLNDAATQVVDLVDATGAALPAGAVYGYALVDGEPATPGPEFQYVERKSL